MEELFQRKTNTKYYMMFQNVLYTNIFQHKINDEIIENTGYKKLLNNGDNYLYFISIKNYGKVGTTKYNISIEETYSTLCDIRIENKPCYTSCRSCSYSNEYADIQNHYCVGCKEGYYPFLEDGTNCYTKEEVTNDHLDWYFDEIRNVFDQCNPACKTCFGSTDENCLSCPLGEISNLLYLYQGKCLTECPYKTFIETVSEGNYQCKDCYINCETCQEIGTSSDMKCDTCSDHKIKYGNQCYEIHDDSIKSFENPEDPTQITSCYELYNYYIKDDSFECIENIEVGYYISNIVTGLLSRCDSNCLTCSETSTHCDTCNDGFYLQDNICVSGCSSQYYLDGRICHKCHDNCLTCSSGSELDESGNLINMKCEQCLVGLTENMMIQIDENCFPILDYEETKITFDISEISSNIIGTCLDFGKAIFYNSYECITKPDNTFYVLSDSQNTGVIKNCNIACETCLGEGTELDTNCTNVHQVISKLKILTQIVY